MNRVRLLIFWKRSEKTILESSDAIACIADTYKNHYTKLTPVTNYFHAPNNVDAEKFYRSSNKRKQLRNTLNIVDDVLVFCYVGAITLYSWHRASVYVQVVKKLQALSLKHRFLFLVPFYSREILLKEFEAAGVHWSMYYYSPWL